MKFSSPLSSNTQARLLLFLLGLFVFFGAGVSAFTPPVGHPADWNIAPPINVTEANQVKGGGLSVNAFTARGNAQFAQKATFKGIVRGSNAASSTIYFGGASNEVGVSILGDVETTGRFQIDDLRHAESQPKRLCADANGKLIFCP